MRQSNPLHELKKLRDFTIYIYFAMNKTIYVIVLLNFLFMSVFGQTQIFYEGEIINRYENNKREGVWKAFNPDKKLMLSCQFKADSLISDVNLYKDSMKMGTLVRSVNMDEWLIFKNNDTIKCYLKKLKKKNCFVDSNNHEFDKNFQDWIFDRLTFLPLYIGGIQELTKFLKKNLDSTDLKGKTEKIMVRFVVNKNGYVVSPKVINRSSKVLNEEALRVIKLMPRWIPGWQNGKFVPVYYTIPIVFN